MVHLKILGTSLDVSYLVKNILMVLGGTMEMLGEMARRVGPMGTLRQTGMDEVADLFHPEPFNVFPVPIDSSNIGPAEFVKILEALRIIDEKRADLLTRLGVDAAASQNVAKGGIVVRAGTDLLAQVALAQELERVRLRLDVRIVVTGTHSPVDVKGSDAKRNFHRSARAAADPRLPPGVYVVIGDDLFSGSDVAKLATKPKDGKGYFYSLGKPLGHFNEHDELILDNEVIAEKTAATSGARAVLNGQMDYEVAPRQWGYVEHLVASRETPISVFRQSLERVKAQTGPDRGGAIVIQGRFVVRADVHEREHHELGFALDFQRFLDECAAHDVLVYTVSRRTATRLNGRIEDYRELGHRDFVRARLKLLPQFFSYDKATLKLAWLLRYCTAAQVAKLMSENFSGELLVPGALPEEFRQRGFPPNNPAAGSSVVIAFPGMTAQVISDAVQNLRVKPGRAAPKLAIYGFGDGNLPFGKNSVDEILREAVASHLLPPHLRVVAEGMNRDPRWDIRLGVRSLTGGRRDEVTLFTIVCDALHKLNPAERRLLLSGYGVNPQALTHFIRGWNHRHPGQTIEPPIRKPEDAIVVHSFYDAIVPELAKRVIKDLLMHTHPMLRELGGAVDRGVRVIMRTQAFLSKSDILRYELGQMSYAVGVVDEQKRAWMGRVFVPR